MKISFMPTPQQIQEVFSAYYQADSNIWERFSEKLTVRTFQKNDIIKDYDGVEKYLNIVAEGSVGLFVWNGKKDICINLLYEKSFMSDYFSFLRQQPSGIKTQALEECTLWSISYPDLNELYARNETGLRIGKAISEILFLKKQQEQINLLTLSPKERYLNLISQRPEIFQRTPLKIIASYLGLTAESLSRLRKRVTGN
ncbi:Crp/Fnr family transcriptional regulator [Chryseobacterium taeanense]|uniref:Crp/Fnr family transcriptional regulator n=1 Tax=Chryseobacterium taeanense TaxID=311334 RepID=UPI0035B16989